MAEDTRETGPTAVAPTRIGRLVGALLALALVVGSAGALWFTFASHREAGCAATTEDAYRDYIHELNTGKPVTLQRIDGPVRVMSVRRDPIPDPVPADQDRTGSSWRKFTVEDYGTVSVTFSQCRQGWRVNDDGISAGDDLMARARYATGELTSLVPMTVRTFDGRDLTGIDRFVATDAPRQPELRLDIGGSDGVPAQSRPANIYTVGNVWDMQVETKGIDLGAAGDRLARATEKHLRFRNTYVGADGKLVRQYVPMTLGRCVVEGGEYHRVTCPFTIPADVKDEQGRPLVMTPATSGAGTRRPSCEVQAPKPLSEAARTGKVDIELRGDTYQVGWRDDAAEAQEFREFDRFCGGRYEQLRDDEDRFLRGAVPTGVFDAFTIVTAPMTEVTGAPPSGTGARPAAS